MKITAYDYLWLGLAFVFLLAINSFLFDLFMTYFREKIKKETKKQKNPIKKNRR